MFLPLLLSLAGGCATGDTVAPILQRGELALASGASEDAADAFASALAMQPRNRQALRGMARSRLAQGDGESALRILAELENLDPAYFRSHARAERRLALHQAARTRMWRGDAGGSLRLLDALREIEPERDAALRDLRFRALIAESGRLQVAGRPAAAAVYFREATGSGRVVGDTAAVLAEALIEIGRASLAVSVLSDALRGRPEDARLSALMDRALDLLYPDSP
ncbi:MAG: tetratricopeptide repeat protein [Myxococcota bacterium]